MKKKNIIFGAVIAVLMGAVSVANAGTITSGGPGLSIFTTQHAIAADKLGVTPGAPRADIAFFIPAAGAGVAGLQTGDTVTFTLTGGAKFNAASWAIEVAKVGFVRDAVNNNPTVTGCVLNAAKTVLTCTGGIASAANSIVTITLASATPGSALYDMDLATANVTLDMTVLRSTLGKVNPVHTMTAGTQPIVFTVTNALQLAGATATAEGAAMTADVAVQFKTFTAAGAATNKDTNNTSGTAFTTGSTTTVGQAQATGTFLFTLSGLPAAATKVTIAGGAVAGTDPTGSDANGVAKTATNGGNFWLDGAGKGYAALVGTANIPPLGNLFITMDGTTPITAGSPQLTITYLPGTTDKFLAHTVLAATNVATITRNGGSFTSDNISTSSVIRIADNNAPSATVGAITYGAWDAAGTAVTQIGTTLPTTVAQGNTVTIAKGVLKAAFPTAVRFNINIESGNVSVTHFKQNAAGLNVIVGSTGTASQL